MAVQRMTVRVLAGLLVALLVAGGGAGHAAASTPSSPTPQSEQAKPFLLHLNGVGGERMIDHTLVRGIKEAGFDAEVEFYDWTGGEIGLLALQAHDKHKSEARKVADLLIARSKANPSRPLYITCHSGGAGIAAFALELLPAEVQVETVIMLAPALSPQYDLSRALSRIRRTLYVFSSPHDSIVLATGTKLFGTIDGIRAEAAGLNGFVVPEDADAEQYKKLVPQPYDRQWLLKYGNAGSHICALRPKFAREYVSKLLMDPPAVAAQPPATQPAPKTALK